MNDPFFSVIIPTFNRANLLREAVRSVLNQTFENFELIVVNDNSTDTTREIIHSFHDERIKFIMNDRTKGGAGARNAGIFRAQGEWIAFLDDDDLWVPEKLDKQFKMIQEIDKNTGFIYAGYAAYDFKSKKIIKIYLPEKEGWIMQDLLYNNYITALCSVAVRKDILIRIGGFDETFPAMQDWDLYIRISEFTSFTCLKEVLVYVGETNTDRISLNLRNKLESINLIRQKYNHFIKKSPRLCHRIATIKLYYSVEMSDWTTALNMLPWTLMGLFVDPCNLFKTMRFILWLFLKPKQFKVN